jgi:hypothetical protein
VDREGVGEEVSWREMLGRVDWTKECKTTETTDVVEGDEGGGGSVGEGVEGAQVGVLVRGVASRHCGVGGVLRGGEPERLLRRSVLLDYLQHLSFSCRLVTTSAQHRPSFHPNTGVKPTGLGMLDSWAECASVPV